MINEEFLNFAKDLNFWNNLKQNEKDLICKNTYKVYYPKGKNVHGGTSDCVGVIFVKKGCLRAYMLSEEGREITLYRLYNGDTCTLSASCIIKSITFDVFIDAEEDTEAFLINSQVYNEIAEKNLYLQNFALNVTVERFSDVMWTMQQILFMSMDKRLAIFLADESAKSESDTIQLTHEQIAKYIGSAREVVSRMLKYFSDEGIVSTGRNGIEILDKKRLLQLAY